MPPLPNFKSMHLCPACHAGLLQDGRIVVQTNQKLSKDLCALCGKKKRGAAYRVSNVLGKKEAP